jgi:hypothetical protein
LTPVIYTNMAAPVKTRPEIRLSRYRDPAAAELPVNPRVS